MCLLPSGFFASSLFSTLVVPLFSSSSSLSCLPFVTKGWMPSLVTWIPVSLSSFLLYPFPFFLLFFHLIPYLTPRAFFFQSLIRRLVLLHHLLSSFFSCSFVFREKISSLLLIPVASLVPWFFLSFVVLSSSSFSSFHLILYDVCLHPFLVFRWIWRESVVDVFLTVIWISFPVETERLFPVMFITSLFFVTDYSSRVM